MNISKRILMTLCFHAVLLGSAKAEDKYTLNGRVTVSPQFQPQAQAQKQAQVPLPLFTARLYFPKAAKKPVLLAYVDSAGSFKFSGLPKGSYLLEIYGGGTLVYQKAIQVQTDLRLEIPLGYAGRVKVVDETKLEQRHRKILADREFQGNLTVYVDDIHADKPFTMVLFETGPEKSRWQDTSRIKAQDIRAIVPKARRLFDGALDPRSRLDADIVYRNQSYTLVVTALETSVTKDSLYFEVYRNEGRPAPREVKK